MQARCGLTTAPLFSPAVIPAHRGMVVEVPLPLAALPGTGTPEAIRAALADHSAGSAVVALGEPPAAGAMLLRGSDAGSDRPELVLSATSPAPPHRPVAQPAPPPKAPAGATPPPPH